MALKFLVNAGADLEAKTDAGWTALHIAASWGNTEAGQFLVEAGFVLYLYTPEATVSFIQSCNRDL